MGNAYLDRIAEQKRDYGQKMERITRQLMMDSLMVSANNVLGLGYDKIMELVDDWEQTYDEIIDSCTGGPEADVIQEHLDAKLADICKGHMDLIPFSKRYPEVKRLRYDRRRH